MTNAHTLIHREGNKSYYVNELYKIGKSVGLARSQKSEWLSTSYKVCDTIEPRLF